MIYKILEYTLVPYLRKKTKTLKGVENIPRDTNFILAPNHWTTADSFFITACLMPYIKEKIYYIAAENVCPHCLRPFFGRAFYLIFRDEKNPADCLEPAKKMLLAGKNIGVFPEGKLKKEGLVKGKTGIARLHLWTQKPILPVGIIGAKVIKKKNPINLLRVVLSHKKAEIFIGRPMMFKEYFNQTITKDILDSITKKIMLELSTLTGQEYRY